MKLKDLKTWINSLSDKELNQQIFVMRNEMGVSGTVHTIKKAEENYHWDGGDDPSELLPRSEWKKRGFDKEDIDSFDIHIKKGQLILEF